MGFHCLFITAIVVYSTSIIAPSLGELLVLRQSLTTIGFIKKLTCISDDDDSAFIWNKAPGGLHPVNPKRYSVSECAIWDSSECRARWGNMGDWKVVGSAVRPMAPVFDFRWKGFKEYSTNKIIDHSEYQYVSKVNQSSGNVVFSVRGKQNVHVLLCEKEDQTKGPCFWIIIAGWLGTTSVLRYCPNGAPADKKPPGLESCLEIDVRVDKGILVSNEWRTFGLRWTSAEKIIELIGDAGHEERTILNGHVESWPNVSHMSIRLDRTSLLRFHFYEYLLTEKSGSVYINTEKFNSSEEEFCVELLVGLCPKCELYVNLLDENERILKIGNISGEENSVYNGTLIWQSIKLSKNITIDSEEREKSLRLEIQAILTGNKGEGRWAIDNFRMCKPSGQRSKSTILWAAIEPDARCQKLSYNGSTIVNPWSWNKIISNTTDSQKFIDKLIESCGSSCESFGENSLLCNSMGCTCNRGYKGTNCRQTCTDGYHGYNCDEICTPCIIGSCDKITGLCATGCSRNTLLPPDCRKEIEKPIVMNITDTTAIVYQNIEFKADANTSIDVVIQVKSSEPCLNFTASLEDPRRPFYYKSNLSNLKLDTIYTVHTIVSIKLADDTISVISSETNFTITCFTLLDFIITPGKNELNLSSILNEVCVNAKDPEFLVRILRLADNETMWERRTTYFPASYANLTPYTEYRVIIFDIKTNIVLFDKKTRTLESAPSEVRNLKATLTTENEATLQWDSPLEMNGLIRNYSISLTGRLIACKGSVAGDIEQIMISQPGNKTTLKISGLRPYAEYTARVIAHTIESGNPKTITFQTSEALIPTSKFSNFYISKDNLTLHWNPPYNCTTITGSTKHAALIFESIESVEQYKKKDQTGYLAYNIPKNLQLTPYTMYRVRLYVIRGWGKPVNPTHYQELKWRTPATSPPPVEKLKVYEADIDTNTISMEWIPPNPAYGEIESYRVTITQRRETIVSENFKVSEERLKCEFREGYVCLRNLQIPAIVRRNNIYHMKICAINKGIKLPGKEITLPITLAIYKQKPSKPVNLTSTPQSQGITMLNWTRQMFSLTKIKKFHIKVHQTGTRLKTHKTIHLNMIHPADTIQIDYSVELHLLASTNYLVSIVAVNGLNITSEESNIFISLPGSIAYADGVNLTVKQTGSFIEVQAPAVVNATDKTTVEIFVKGPTTCTKTNSSEPSTPMKMREWLAAVYEPEENRTENLTIGANYNHDVPLNCSLHIGETYEIKLLATDLSPDTSSEELSASITLDMDDDQSAKSNKGWLEGPPILAICLLVLVFTGFRIRKRVQRQEPREPSYVEPISPSLNKIPRQPRPFTYTEVIPLSMARGTNDCTDLHLQESSVSQLDVVKNESSDDLYSLPKEPDPCPVGIEYFERYVKDAAASGLLDSQFMLLPKDLTRPYEYGSLPENMPKNRCKYQIAYDHSQVVLKKIPGEPYSDYINASYIKGYRENKAYIAAEGPKPNTVNDFWRMVWQEEVRVICMLTDFTKDAETEGEKYWPDVGTMVVQGDFHISNIDEQVSANYTLRIFELSHGQNTRQVRHLHYTEWPNLGVPTYRQSLVEYLEKLGQTGVGNDPILVHCSTGDDRTGTVILCDICLRQAITKKVIDVTAEITRMRDNRANMVGTLQQYVLAHIIITESVVSWSMQIPTDVLLAGIKHLRMRLPHDIQRLNDSKWQEQALKSSATRNLPTAQEEANAKILDLEPDIPEVIYDDVADKHRDHINAVSVDSFKMNEQYLACSLPPPLTLASFWGFIVERDIKLIIIMQCSDPKYPTCIDIMPYESIVIPMLDIQVEDETSLDEREYFTYEKLLLRDTSKDKARSQSVAVLTCKGWECGRNQKPPPPATLISLWRASEKIPRKKGETLVLCHDGITGCGLYLALSFLLERMTVERECNVISAVRSVRRSEREFVQSLKQLDYLYDAAVNYSERFLTYANLS